MTTTESMSEPKAGGIVEAVLAKDVDLEFQLDALEFFALAIIRFPDPSMQVEEWLDTAPVESSARLYWSLRTWDALQNSPYFTCELLLREIAALRAGGDETA